MVKKAGDRSFQKVKDLYEKILTKCLKNRKKVLVLVFVIFIF